MDPRADELWLEPLGAAHAAALAWQYRSPVIAALTQLPPLHDSAHAADWIQHRLAQPVLARALMAPRVGLVGCVEVMLSGQDAFLCFWMGTDWQGRGWGQRLIALGCELAVAEGAWLMLTATLQHNAPSRAALRRCGFSELPWCARPPDDDRVFLYRVPTAIDPVLVWIRLVDFAARMNTGMDLSP